MCYIGSRRPTAGQPLSAMALHMQPADFNAARGAHTSARVYTKRFAHFFGVPKVVTRQTVIAVVANRRSLSSTDISFVDCSNVSTSSLSKQRSFRKYHTQRVAPLTRQRSSSSSLLAAFNPPTTSTLKRGLFGGCVFGSFCFFRATGVTRLYSPFGGVQHASRTRFACFFAFINSY